MGFRAGLFGSFLAQLLAACPMKSQDKAGCIDEENPTHQALSVLVGRVFCVVPWRGIEPLVTDYEQGKHDQMVPFGSFLAHAIKLRGESIWRRGFISAKVRYRKCATVNVEIHVESANTSAHGAWA